MSAVRAVSWQGDATSGCLRLLDQTRLPTEITFRDCRSVDEVWDAIKRLQVRGAPAIGIAAAYGIVIGLQAVSAPAFEDVHRIAGHLRTSRPTAVNLFWALDRMERAAGDSRNDLQHHLLTEAHAIHDEDAATCRRIGEVGAELIASGMGILTHCNAGALATADYGTALAAIFLAVEQGKTVSVYVDETRPLLQGARLTAWELQQRRIPATLLCDNMAAQVMKEGKVKMVIVGADRIAANGDTANKIGTYGVAVLARHHGIPFYVAAPRSTFDLSLPDGNHIPIEQRSPEEITHSFGKATAPTGIAVYNPAFDVTPAQLITGIFTEAGLIQPVNCGTVADTIQRK
jgi:methylthioribose-1-phosphate isomerase